MVGVVDDVEPAGCPGASTELGKNGMRLQAATAVAMNAMLRRVASFVRISLRLQHEARRRTDGPRSPFRAGRGAPEGGYGLTSTCMKVPCDETLATLITVFVCGLFTLFQPASHWLMPSAGSLATQ